MEYQVSEIARAIFIINRHAKTALNPKELYNMKKQAIDKLLTEQQAKKIGLHYSQKPKFSKQHSTVLVQVADYYFHVPPSKQDFKTVQHLGELDQTFRNPKTKMSLNQAKRVICQYLGIPYNNKKHKPHTHSNYTPSSLGKWNYSYYNHKRHR
ncbi:YkyB-like protein [Pelagirhabdus alkalitolerans]|uniref:YkyB-like protein n=1 Tax=Pelagirhabdus alkalitolerans TaxID=1612202 RepID=A0A1G6GYE5_9BACI|nr:YkyB family protein [Pelagirhabdus alkalitolerans]SDB87052.1 YkyB-like protein [Pelagirhabdus alkalitolerans]